MRKFNSIELFLTRPWLLISIILLITFFSYLNSLNNEFIRWDDDKQITENSFVKTISKENIIHNFYEERFTFIPLTIYSILYLFFGLDAFYFHLLSLFIHLLNVFLAYLVVRKISDNVLIAVFSAMLFALHPMRVESVAWISELKDLLFALFTLMSYLVYINYLKKNLKIKFFIIVVLLSVLASYSKIQGLLIAPSLLLFDFLYERKITFYSIAEKALIFIFSFFFYKLFKWYYILIIPALVFLFYKLKTSLNNLNKKQSVLLIIISALLFLLSIVIYLILFPNLWTENPDKRNVFTVLERFFLAGFAISFYTLSIFYPFRLNAVHPYPQRLADGSLPLEYYFSSIMLVIVFVVSILLIIKRKRIHRLIIFGWFFFLINISIVLHLIPIEGRLVVADRYSYLAYLGIFVILSLGIYKLLSHYKKIKKLTFVILLGISFLFSFATYNRTLVWKNTLSLFEDVIFKNPNVPFAYLNLGGVYLNKRQSSGALKYFNLSIKQDSLDPAAYFNRALGYFMAGNADSSLFDFQKVIELSHSKYDIALVYTNMGEIYQKTGQDSLAFVQYQKAIEIDSSIASSYNNRGMYYFEKQDLTNAFLDFDKAVKLNPDFPDAWNNRGWVLTKKENLKEALESFDRSLKLNPDYAMAYNNRGYLKFKTANLQGALSDYNKAISLDSTLTEAYLNRGWLYSSSGNFKMAVNDFTVVLKRIENNQVALTNRGFAWYYLNEIEKARIDFENLLKQYPENATNHQNYAWIYMQLNKYDIAKKEFEKAIEMDSSLVSSYLNLGWIFLKEGDADSADNVLTKVLRQDKNNYQTLYLLGEAKRKKGKIKEACELYNTSLQKGSKEALEAINKYCK